MSGKTLFSDNGFINSMPTSTWNDISISGSIIVPTPPMTTGNLIIATGPESINTTNNYLGTSIDLNKNILMIPALNSANTFQVTDNGFNNLLNVNSTSPAVTIGKAEITITGAVGTITDAQLLAAAEESGVPIPSPLMTAGNLVIAQGGASIVSTDGYGGPINCTEPLSINPTSNGITFSVNDDLSSAVFQVNTIDNLIYSKGIADNSLVQTNGSNQLIAKTGFTTGNMLVASSGNNIETSNIYALTITCTPDLQLDHNLTINQITTCTGDLQLNSNLTIGNLEIVNDSFSGSFTTTQLYDSVTAIPSSAFVIYEAPVNWLGTNNHVIGTTPAGKNFYPSNVIFSQTSTNDFNATGGLYLITMGGNTIYPITGLVNGPTNNHVTSAFPLAPSIVPTGSHTINYQNFGSSATGTSSLGIIIISGYLF